MIRKGRVESRLNFVVPPPKYEVKRSKSTPASVWMLLNTARLAVVTGVPVNCRIWDITNNHLQHLQIGRAHV